MSDEILAEVAELEEIPAKRKTTTSNAVKQRYRDRNYDVVSLTVPTGLKDKWKGFAKNENISMAKYICTCIEKYEQSKINKIEIGSRFYFMQANLTTIGEYLNNQNLYAYKVLNEYTYIKSETPMLDITKEISSKLKENNKLTFKYPKDFELEINSENLITLNIYQYNLDTFEIEDRATLNIEKSLDEWEYNLPGNFHSFHCVRNSLDIINSKNL